MDGMATGVLPGLSVAVAAHMYSSERIKTDKYYIRQQITKRSPHNIFFHILVSQKSQQQIHQKPL
jgi:hypothetical protein